MLITQKIHLREITKLIILLLPISIILGCEKDELTNSTPKEKPKKALKIKQSETLPKKTSDQKISTDFSSKRKKLNTEISLFDPKTIPSPSRYCFMARQLILSKSFAILSELFPGP